jgi:hypothetical protein
MRALSPAISNMQHSLSYLDLDLEEASYSIASFVFFLVFGGIIPKSKLTVFVYRRGVRVGLMTGELRTLCEVGLHEKKFLVLSLASPRPHEQLTEKTINKDSK